MRKCLVHCRPPSSKPPWRPARRSARSCTWARAPHQWPCSNSCGWGCMPRHRRRTEACARQAHAKAAAEAADAALLRARIASRGRRATARRRLRLTAPHTDTARLAATFPATRRKADSAREYVDLHCAYLRRTAGAQVTRVSVTRVELWHKEAARFQLPPGAARGWWLAAEC